MSVQILRFEESLPVTYPELQLLTAAGDVDETLTLEPAIWLRLERYISQRWSPRQCVWTVNGPGDFLFHLGPVSDVTVDVWDDTLKVWESATVELCPLGYRLTRTATYRLTATVGDTEDPVPQPICEAYARLQAYTSERYHDDTPAGAASYSLDLADGISESVTRSPAWLAKALQFSGAADLLRNYRTV